MQLIRYVRVGMDEVAWSAEGAGPPLVLGGWWASHLVHDDESAAFRAFVDRLAEHRTVIRYDPPGVGLSRHATRSPARAEAPEDALAAVIEAAGAAPAAVVAGSSGCAVAVTVAADRPDLIGRLVLYGGFRRGADLAAPSDRGALVDLVRNHWGLSSRVLTDIFLPEATAAERREFAAVQRRSASAAEAATALEAVYRLDATAAASRVARPTLVLHRRDDRAIRVALGRDLADSIPGARLELVEGTSHFPWYGDADAVLSRTLEFLGVAEDPPALPPATEHGVSALTIREVEVLQLVAEGLTDAQIGRRLYLSPHTIHRHVANARGKLGAPTRAAAAAMIAAAGVQAGG